MLSRLFYRARYYNPTLGRFVSEDPIGFAGGINPYRYAEDNPARFVGPLGWDVTVTLWPGAFGNGHVGVGVNTNDTSGFYPDSHSLCLIFGCDVPGSVENDEDQHPGITPVDVIVIPTTPAQDAAMERAMNEWKGAYNLYGRNCASFVEYVLNAGGVSVPQRTVPWWLMKDLHQIHDPSPINLPVSIPNGPPIDLEPSFP